MSKGFLVESGMQDTVFDEKNIQMMMESPFIIKLHETYADQENLYLLLEAALGGELSKTYQTKLLYGNLNYTTFYVAGVALALEHLHEHKVIYRDLKAEN